MSNLLDGGLRAEIGLDPDMRALMLPVQLVRRNKTLTGGRWVDGSPSTVNALGFLETRRAAVFSGGGSAGLGQPELVCVILGLDAAGAVVPEPMPLDGVVIQGETHTVKTVERDPAGATWTLTLTEVGA